MSFSALSDRLQLCGATLNLHVQQFDKSIPVGEVRLPCAAPATAEFAGVRWHGATKIEALAAPAVWLADLTHEAEQGTAENTSLGAVLSFAGWSVDNYVLMPAAAYNGNRFAARVPFQYPPLLKEPADIGPDVPTIITDVPRLTLGPGPSKLQLFARDLSTPASAFSSRRGSRRCSCSPTSARPSAPPASPWRKVTTGRWRNCAFSSPATAPSAPITGAGRRAWTDGDGRLAGGVPGFDDCELRTRDLLEVGCQFVRSVLLRGRGVNRQAFQLGDSILLKSGGVWQGQVRPQGSGAEGKPSGRGLDSDAGYQLQPTSPCRNAGVPVPNNGDRDFWGNPLGNGKPDIGAHESQSPTKGIP